MFSCLELASIHSHTAQDGFMIGWEKADMLCIDNITLLINYGLAHLEWPTLAGGFPNQNYNLLLPSTIFGSWNLIYKKIKPTFVWHEQGTNTEWIVTWSLNCNLRCLQLKSQGGFVLLYDDLNNSLSKPTATKSLKCRQPRWKIKVGEKKRITQITADFCSPSSTANWQCLSL